MTRRNLVLAITEESGLQQFQVKQIVQEIFEAIVVALLQEGRVELRNFASLKCGSERLAMVETQALARKSGCPQVTPSF